MIRLLLVALALASAGCASPAVPETGHELEVLRRQNEISQEKLQKLQQQTRDIEESTRRIEMAALTPEQEQKANLLAEVYFAALAKTISQIDDLISPPEVIARAAISANIDLLTARMEAQMIHLIQASPAGEKAVRRRLAELPSEYDIDNAVYMVMHLRAAKAEPGKEKLKPYQGPPANKPPVEITI